MPDFLDDVAEMMNAFEQHIETGGAKVPDEETKKLRIKLIDEELHETLNAMEDDNLVAIADGIADSIVVLLGTALSYGIPLDKVWDEVHISNMAKLGGDGKPHRRPDGKVMKPNGWIPPDITWCLDKFKLHLGGRGSSVWSVLKNAKWTTK